MIKRYSVDRIVEGIAVLIPDGEGDALHLDANEYSLSANDIADIELDGSKVLSLTKDERARAERLSKAKSKLHSLFAKKKKD